LRQEALGIQIGERVSAVDDNVLPERIRQIDLRLILSVPAGTALASLSAFGILRQPFRRQAMLHRGINHMANCDEDINDEKKSARSKADFFRLAGIGAELAEFLTEFVEKPDHFYSIPFQRRCEIEKQMDAVLLAFERW